MQPADALLLAALRTAPRRYRLPPLPAAANTARAGGPRLALAFAIEAARSAPASPPAAAGELFTWALAGLIREALAPAGGDPAFQALVLRTQDPEVDEHVRLAAQMAADRRVLRTASDAIAHPGKIRSRAAGPLRDVLAQVHQAAAAGAWTQLRETLERGLAHDPAGDLQLRPALRALLSLPGLARLERAGTLLERAGVQRYRALCAQAGPLAGSEAAAAQGRASSRAGDGAEHSAVQAFRAVAGLLDRHVGAAGSHRVVRSLRTPAAFPGPADKAKDEWDAAIVRASDPDSAADIVLLAEVKTAPAAATPDFPRLLRGLQRLALASADAHYRFASANHEVRVAGASLRGLAPQGQLLPPHVIYCCRAPAEPQPPVLGAAARAVLLAEPASLAFARSLLAGAMPPDEDLAPVWQALATAPRLRSALHQYETARAVREAMLHPDDLLAAVQQATSSAPAG